MTLGAVHDRASMEITAALKGIVPISVTVALVAVTSISIRWKHEQVAWWQRVAAWLAIAKATRFVLECVVCGWIGVRSVLHGDALIYQSVVCGSYLATVPLLVATALRLLRHDERVRRSGVGAAALLLAIEASIAITHRLAALDEAAHAAVGIAAVSTRGSVMMTAEALLIGTIAWRTTHRAEAHRSRGDLPGHRVSSADR